jgi:hypothetical protein
MKKVKFIMDSGKEYIYQAEGKNADMFTVVNMFFEDGKPKEKWILITGEDMENKIIIVPKHVSSIEEF